MGGYGEGGEGRTGGVCVRSASKCCCDTIPVHAQRSVKQFQNTLQLGIFLGMGGVGSRLRVDVHGLRNGVGANREPFALRWQEQRSI